AQQAPATIVEDDSQLHRQFPRWSEHLTSRLGSDWDIILWGWNFDTLVGAEIPGLGPFTAYFDNRLMRANSAQYLENHVSPTILKLVHAFGVHCYSVSPRGARRLLDNIRPLRKMDISLGLNRVVPNISIDCMMNRFYSQLGSFVAFPPLALSPNDKSTSTVFS